MDIILEDVRQTWNGARNSLIYKSSHVVENLNTPIDELLNIEDINLETPHEFLLKLLNVKEILDPLAKSCEEKLKTIKLTHDTGPIRVGTLHGLSRRLGPHTRPPPEYSDPSGSDAFCVPGYVFPCPDVQIMLRSTLFLGGTPQAMLRCLPPEIGAELQPGFTAVYVLKLNSKTNDAECFYSINLDMLRPYNLQQPPKLSAPGEYNIQAYSRANGYLPSEMSIKTLTLSVELGDVRTPSVQVAAPAPKASAFGGLFLGGEEDESDDD